MSDERRPVAWRVIAPRAPWPRLASVRATRCRLEFLLLLSATPVHAQGWSTAPLRSPTPIPRDGLPVERPAFNAWLKAHKDSLSPAQALAARERLYAYISGEAKSRGGSLPGATDTGAISAFVLAAQLGDPGAMLITQQWMGVKGPHSMAAGGVVVRYEAPYLVVGSDDAAWRVCYPYFFMTTPSPRTRAPSGVSAEVISLATLFAPDKGPHGSSQGTILLVAAPPQDSTRLLDDWLTRLSLTPMGQTEAPGAWYRGADGGQTARVAVVRRLPRRVVLLAYGGARGSYEVNRTHFETLVSRLGTGPCAP